jgi:hypothetical protein
MRLDELLPVLSETDASHWEVLEGYPIFHHSFEISSRGGGDPAITGVETHTNRAILRSDVDIALEWGARRMPDEEEYYAWNDPQLFPDAGVRSFWVDLFYRGSVVYREMLAYVDGGRAVLPVADSRPADPATSSATPQRKFEGQTSRQEYELARLIDTLGGGGEYESYFARSGFKVS